MEAPDWGFGSTTWWIFRATYRFWAPQKAKNRFSGQNTSIPAGCRDLQYWYSEVKVILIAASFRGFLILSSHGLLILSSPVFLRPKLGYGLKNSKMRLVGWIRRNYSRGW